MKPFSNISSLYTAAIALLLCLLAPATAYAQDSDEDNDPGFTIQVYNSWDAILDHYPDTVMNNVEIDVYSPYDIDFIADSRGERNILKDKAIAVTVNDTIWFISGKWMKRNFTKGQRVKRWAPLLFTAKAAMFTYIPTNVGLQILGGLLTGDTDAFGRDPYYDPPFIYYLDFDTKTILKLGKKEMSALLSRYRDLQVRYDSTDDNGSDTAIDYYLNEYITRLTRDPSIPYLNDRVESN